jgi:acyl-CoA thioester hydrolase
VRRPYFRREEGSPPPLSVLVHRQVRFEEVDSIGIVWHGRYPSYFEDARVAFGSKYGVGYEDFIRHQCPAPIKRMHLDYRLPLSFNDRFTVEGILHWSDAARMNFEFIIRNADEAIVTTGYSIQVLLDREGNLLLVPPPFIEEFRQRWRAGAIG